MTRKLKESSNESQLSDLDFRKKVLATTLCSPTLNCPFPCLQVKDEIFSLKTEHESQARRDADKLAEVPCCLFPSSHRWLMRVVWCPCSVLQVERRARLNESYYRELKVPCFLVALLLCQR